MRIAIVQFPGSNCERETILAVERAGMEPIEFLWNEPREKLRDMDGFILVGGFSYEDRSRAGIIAALDPVMEEIKVQSESGKPILGICNGAQILVETGLVPGLENAKIGMALAENKRVLEGKVLGTGYYNAWINMRVSDEYQRNAFTRHLTPKNILQVPIAHAEGRFIMTQALLEEVKAQGLNVFQYCDKEGNLLDHFPINPNGSVANIAAVANKKGNVMAIMPHPERTEMGDVIFQSMRDYIADAKNVETVPLYYYPRRPVTSPYRRPAGVYECIVELIITDNQALTVQNKLRQIGIPVTVKRQVHWQVCCDYPEIFKDVKASGVLYNDRKERLFTSQQTNPPKRASFLVRSKEDLLGQQKLQTLKDHFLIQGVSSIQHGIIWHFCFENDTISDQIEKILQTHIIYNPYAHECYQYN